MNLQLIIPIVGMFSLGIGATCAAIAASAYKRERDELATAIFYSVTLGKAWPEEITEKAFSALGWERTSGGQSDYCEFTDDGEWPGYAKSKCGVWAPIDQVEKGAIKHCAFCAKKARLTK